VSDPRDLRADALVYFVWAALLLALLRTFSS
jgi:hypothetical protein